MRIPYLTKYIERKISRSIRSAQDNYPNKGAGKVIKAGQVSKPSITLFGRAFGAGTGTIVPRRNVIFDLDVDRLKAYGTNILLRNLNAISPDASMALWVMLRLCSAKYTIDVSDYAGGESKKGQAYMDYLVATLNREQGGIKNLFNQAFKSVYVQGACSGEVVLAPNLKDTVKLAMVDPSTITYFQENRGEGDTAETVLIPKQLVNGTYQSLEKEGFYYIPLDPDIGDPYGTSPIVSFLQVIFFYMRMIFDLNQATHNQAWARLHVKIVEEIIRKNASAKLQQNDQKMAEFIDDQLGKIQNLYDSMEPDDTFITTDATEIKEVGGQHSGGTMSVKVLDTVLQRLLANALKTMSTFLNQHGGKTETYSSVEWMIQVAGVDSIRAIVKSMFDAAFSFMMQMKGIPAKVSIEFEQIPLNGIITEETGEWLKTRRIIYARDAGILGHDHAAQLLFGMEEADEEPVAMQTNLREGAPGEESRAASEDHKDGFKTINNSQLRAMEEAFIKELGQEYDRLSQSVKDEMLKGLELEE